MPSILHTYLLETEMRVVRWKARKGHGLKETLEVVKAKDRSCQKKVHVKKLGIYRKKI